MTGLLSTTRVVIPIKQFSRAKQRLTGTLDDHQRATLAQILAQGVVAAAMASGCQVAVVCDDDETAYWAENTGVDVIRSDGTDLNGAAQISFQDSSELGFSHMAIVHADLPLVVDLRPLVDPAPDSRDRDSEMLIVADVEGVGTNALVIPTRSDFTFAFGPDSYARHVRHAALAGLSVVSITDPALAWDVDEPADLNVPSNMCAPNSSAEHLARLGLMRLTEDSTDRDVPDTSAGVRLDDATVGQILGAQT